MPGIGKRIISYPGSSGDDYCGILWLPDAIKRLEGTDLFAEPVSVVLGCRASSPGEIEKGSLRRQQEDCLARIRALGGRVVEVVGMDRPRTGKLSTRRQDLMEGVCLARQHNAILCYRDLVRLFHPAAYHQRDNPDAPYLRDDFARLRQFIGDVALAVIVPLDLTVNELHSRATRRGMEQARAKGKLPGRPSAISDRYKQLMIHDRHAGLSMREIADRYGFTKSAVQRWLAYCETITSGPRIRSEQG